jgi:hypothetical protein
VSARRTWAKLAALLLPGLRCAACQSQPADPFDPRGAGLVGALTAAGVDGAHLLGEGTLSYAVVPCGESRFVGYHGRSGLGGYSGASPYVHRIDVAARAEPAPGSLRVRVTAPDGVAAHDQTVAVAATQGAGQTFDVRVDARRPAPDGAWVVELRAEGACRAIRLTLSMHQAPISGP